MCAFPGCNEAIYGHTFCDHEPVLRATVVDEFDAVDEVADSSGDLGCRICGAPPPRRTTFGWLRCEHQTSGSTIEVARASDR
jgi:hypothetical protein